MNAHPLMKNWSLVTESKNLLPLISTGLRACTAAVIDKRHPSKATRISLNDSFDENTEMEKTKKWAILIPLYLSYETS